MKEFMYRFWLMNCSVVLFITYLLCFGSTASLPSQRDVANNFMLSTRTNVVEVVDGVEVKGELIKESYKQNKNEERGRSIFLPLLPLVFYVFSFGYKSDSGAFNYEREVYLTSAFIPSLGANAPPIQA